MAIANFPWLSAILVFPLVAALAIPFLPDKDGKTVRLYTLAVGLIDFAMMIYGFWSGYDQTSASFQLRESYAWIPQIGLNWSVSVDGLSVTLVILTGLVNTLSILAAWQVTHKPKLFYFLMLVMYSAQLGVFTAQDMLMFFLMWEVELVPVYLLISIWGGQKRRYAATKFILYTAAASIFILVAGLAMAFSGDQVTFDLATLGMKEYPLALELLAYGGLLVAFGVKLPIFPLHTWLPDAHGEASAPVSMILAGVLLKMGGYGLIRMNLEMLPNAHVYFAPVLAVLGVVNIVYGAFNSFAQTNMKRRLAYSSISHMGFVLIGIASFTEVGISGAVLQMVSHGLIAACLFFLAGVTYDRTHTLIMAEMGGIAKVMPKAFALFTAGSMASLALPGMSGFVGEISVFLGISTSEVYSSSFKVAMVFLSAIGLILTPIYLLSMLRQVFYAGNLAPSCDLASNGKLEGHREAVCFGNSCVLPANAHFSDANPREVFVAASLLLPIIAIGFYPKLATQLYDAKTVAVSAEVRSAYAAVTAETPQLYSHTQVSDRLVAKSAPLLGVFSH
ncbi:MAG: NAD(P)H-quinone oxidoreductase subunit 4 [Pseudanabaenaceae cyanobacterium bins.68]|nr:NAD(P)H-quinone oxidoreductase subunit 4 [Pseudanabaenaceae cyanobacterium bins.68]